MKTRRTVLSGILANALIPVMASAAPTRDRPSPAALLQRAVDQHAIPGVVSLVLHRGRVARMDVAGFRDVERQLTMRRDTIFRIASMTKPITAAAVLMLVDDGVIALDVPVEKWLPELANRRVLRDPSGPLSDTQPARRSLTARDLLTYRAGYTHWFFMPPASPLARAMEAADLGSTTTLNLAITPDEFMRRLGELPMMYQPGEVWQYQTPSEILGVLVRRAAGKPFEEFLAERLFGPLGMIDTDFVVPDAKLDRFASAYMPSPAGLVRIDEPATSPWRKQPAFASGAGGLVSTADDYGHFAQMLLNKGTIGRRRLLKPETINAMATNALSDEQRLPRPSLNPAIPEDQHRFEKRGFGLGVAVTLSADAHMPAPGSYGWDGLYGTEWTNDPATGIARIFMMQVMGGQHSLPLSKDYTHLAYAELGY